MSARSEYERGIKDGLRAYAHWRDGRQEVGTTGTFLSDAIAKIPKLHVYDPPDEVEALPADALEALRAAERALMATSCEDPECGSDTCSAYIAILQLWRDRGIAPLAEEAPRAQCRNVPPAEEVSPFQERDP